MENGEYVPGSIYFYAPNKGAPVFFAVAFLASGILHFYQCWRYKSWWLTWLYVFCAVLFVAGFIVREIGAFNYDVVNVYIVTVCLVYAAPPLYELANYNILGRILYFVPYYSPIHPGRVLTTFAAISAVVEALSGNGASYVSNANLSEDKRNMGKALLKAALIIQLGVIGLFVTLAVFFHTRCLRNGINSPKINEPLKTLYLSTTIVAIRTIYRTVEYFSLAQLDFSSPDFQPSSMSPIIRYEWFFYFFEATLMLSNSLLINWRHPRRWLPLNTKIYLGKDGVTEIEGPGYKAERNFLLTLIDPFDLWSLFTGKNKKNKFWEEAEVTAGDKPKTGASHVGTAEP